MTREVRILTFSTLYPSSARPGHGIFVETRLRELLRGGGVVSKVVAPVPWFFSSNPRFGEYAKLARTPLCETRDGIDVLYPRFLLPPKIGMNIAPIMLAMGGLPALAKLRRDGYDFDLIDAHYFYPDGVAAAILAAWFDRPLVVTARGSDVTLIPQHRIPRSLIQWTAGRAAAVISVSRALRDALVGLGAAEARLHVLRNGVDLDRFRLLDRAATRVALGWPDQPTLISVGNLNKNKGHHLIIDALCQLPDFRLVIVGQGPERELLKAQASRLGLLERILFAGEVPQTALSRFFSAADISVLASEREGWPNVLLESMACGTPVVATRIWGTPEIVKSSEAGRLAGDRSASGIAGAVVELMANYPERVAVRRYAEAFSWEATSRGQFELFTRILGEAS